MMKFFALVALAIFATANAQVTGLSVSRTSEVSGTAGGDLVVTFTAATLLAPSTAGGADKTITVAVDGAIFAANADTACTATVTESDGTTTVSPAPTFQAGTGGTASSGDVTGQGSNTETLVLKMGTGNDDTIAANHIITITCDGNLVAKNAAAATTYTYSVSTSADQTVATATYTLTQTSSTAFTASRGTGATNLMTGMSGGDLTFSFTPTTALAAGDTITLTPRNAANNAGVDLFTASSADGGGATGATACTATVVDATTAPTFVSNQGIVSGASGSQVLTLTLDSATATDVVAATKAATIVCTSNLAVNTAAGAVTFNFATGTDTSALAAQTGYTIGAKTVTAFTAARATSLVTGVAGGDLTFTFKATTAIAADGYATITASQALYTAADASTTCATTVSPGSAPTSTTTMASSGTGVTGNNVLVVTFVGHGVDADSTATVVCSANLAVNGAAGAVTFGIKTFASDDSALDTEATGQAGYTIAAATSAASSTASVSMLTMLALAAVAMRQ